MKKKADKLRKLNGISDHFKDSETMPLLFLGHGSPMNAIEENEFVRGWRQAGQSIPKPNAILCISAHWETPGTFVTAMDNPPTIHDFGGFPKKLYEVSYPAPGSPELVYEMQRMVSITAVEPDYKWGLDHGCWTVVKHLFPSADIPVIQMSLDYRRPAQYHYDLAKELVSLRKKGILITGSGNMIHNLQLVAWDRLSDDEYGYDWAMEASEKMKAYILSGEHQQLINYKSLGPAFKLAIPTPDHFLPLLYILALKNKDEKVSLFNDKAIAGSLTMTSVRIGND
jgi:4,5-DOPA dioxygenase extradiol